MVVNFCVSSPPATPGWQGNSHQTLAKGKGWGRLHPVSCPRVSCFIPSPLPRFPAAKKAMKRGKKMGWDDLSPGFITKISDLKLSNFCSLSLWTAYLSVILTYKRQLSSKQLLLVPFLPARKKHTGLTDQKMTKSRIPHSLADFNKHLPSKELSVVTSMTLMLPKPLC